MINLMELLISFPLWMSTLALISAGIYSLRYRDYRPAMAFGMSMFLAAVWALSYGLELISPGILLKIIWAKIQLSIIPFVAIAVLITAAEHTQQTRWLNSRVFYLINVIPLINLLVVWVPGLHQYYRSGYWLNSDGGILSLMYSTGPWEGMIAAFIYGMLMVAIGLYISSLATSKGVYFWQTLFLTIAILIPTSASIWQNLFQNYIIPNYDIIPSMMLFTGLLSLYSLWRHQWLQISPIARHQIVDNLQDAILVVDGQGRLLDFNASASRLLGLSSGNLSLPARKAIEAWDEIESQLASQHSARIKIKSPTDHIERDYELLENSISGSKSQLPSRIIYLRQITPNLLLQERLSQLSQIVQQSPTAVVVTDTQGLIQYVNPQFTTLTGYQPEEVIGRNTNLLKSGQTPEETYKALWKDITQGRTWRGEILNKRKDGSTYWESCIIAPIFDENNKIASYVSIKEDITQRKSTEDLLQKRFNEITVISELSMAAAAQLDLTQLSRLVGGALEESFSAESVLIALLNKKTDLIEIPYWSIKGNLMKPEPFKRGQGLTSIVLDTKKTLLIDEDFPNKARELGGVMTYVQDYGYPQTWLGVPILAGQEALGVISMQDYDLEHAYSDEEINALSAIASNVSSAIQNAQLYEETQRELAERKRAESETNRKAEQLAILYAISRDLSSGLELGKLLQTLRERCHQIAPFDTFGIATYDENAKALKYLALYEGNKIQPDFTRDLRKLPGVSSQVIESKHTQYIPDTSKVSGERTIPLGNRKDESGQSYLGIPFMKGDKVTGLMTLQAKKIGAFSPEHIQIFETVASHAAAAIENARLFEETRRRADELSILYELGLDVSSNIRMEEVMRKLMEKCQQLLAFDAFYIAIYDEVTHTVHHPLFYDEGRYVQMPSRDIRITPGLSGEIILSRKTLHIPDVLDRKIEGKYQIIHAGGRDSRTYLGVPLIVRDKVVGVISIQSYTPNQYSPEQVRLFETISTQAAIAIENSKTYEKARDEIDQRRKMQEDLEDQLVKVEAIQQELREQAYRDALTDLHNRRFLNENLPKKISIARKKNAMLSIIMLDVDNFKNFNDTYGHEIGDFLLKKVGELLRQHTRSTDIAARYGGEEFLVAFPDMPIEAAARRAESIRSLFEQSTLRLNDLQISATLSLGVAAFPIHGSTAQEVIIQADQALYEAKSKGKNRVVVWSTK